MKTLGVLLAAGQSRRFGAGDKLLAPWRGEPLVLAAALNLSLAGCDDLGAVVSSDAVAEVLPQDFRRLGIAAGQDMAFSFRRACAHAEETGADRLLIALGDMPSVRRETFLRLTEGPAESRACICDGKRLPPVLLMRADWCRAGFATGDHGARAIVVTLPETALVALGRDEAQDIDTLADLAARS